MIKAWKAVPVLVGDGGLAVALALVTLGVPLLGSGTTNPNGFTPVWAVLACAVCAPLTVRRRLPLTAALASGTAVLLAIILGHPSVATWVTVVAFASAAYHRDRARWLTAVLAACWLVTAGLLTGDAPSDPSSLSRLAMSVFAGLAPVLLGHVLRLNQSRTQQLVLVERAQERTRIARDVHDVVGHHLSAIRLQAVGARRGTPADADQALKTIAEISATALGDTRRLLGLLRDDDGDTDLSSLAARLSQQGLRVRLRGGSLLEGVALRVRHAAYRIVQESLTNVMRHSGSAQATVRIERSGHDLTIVVQDDGQATPSSPARPDGDGLRGMRERAELLGGTLTAGPRTSRGWQVTARLPVDDSAGRTPTATGASPAPTASRPKPRSAAGRDTQEATS